MSSSEWAIIIVSRGGCQIIEGLIDLIGTSSVKSTLNLLLLMMCVMLHAMPSLPVGLCATMCSRTTVAPARRKILDVVVRAFATNRCANIQMVSHFLLCVIFGIGGTFINLRDDFHCSNISILL